MCILTLFNGIQLVLSGHYAEHIKDNYQLPIKLYLNYFHLS